MHINIIPEIGQKYELFYELRHSQIGGNQLFILLEIDPPAYAGMTESK